MNSVLLAVVLLTASVSAASAADKQLTKGNSMVAKVIQMLGEEKDKIAANIEAETKVMAEYTEWCDDTMTEHSYAIKSAKAKITDLTAVITDATAQIASLNEDIDTLGKEIAEHQADIDEATAIREKDKAEFEKAEAEQVEMVEKLEELGVALKEQMNAIAQTPAPVMEEGEAPAEAAAAFLQVGAHNADATMTNLAPLARDEKLKKALTIAVNSIWVDPESKKNLALLNQDGAFIQSQDDQPEIPSEPATAHKAEAEEQKNEELAAFEGLKGKAEEALQRMRDEEVKKVNEHEVNIMALKQAIALAENKLDDANKDKARISQEKSEAEEELVETEASLAADTKALASVTAECTAAAEAWATRQTEAKAEQAAIEKAKEILASRVTVFFQLSHQSAYNDQDDAKHQAKAAQTRAKLAGHFRGLGNKLHSLAMLNLVTAVESDPMEKVKGLLNELIAKLVKEAKEAADLHEFCQAEKKKTTAAIKKKNMAIDKLNARIETASTKKEQLEESIADLSAELAEMEKSQAEATKLRNEEHTVFMKTEADFTMAAEAVDDAIDALKEYYGGAALVQTDRSAKAAGKAPPVLGGAKSDSAGGIVSILETMGEDFRKTLKTARAEERAAQDAYDTLVQENKVASGSKTAEIKGAESEIKSLKVSIHDNGGDLKMTNKELASVNEYVAKLKPQCGGRTVPYEERKAKRDAEIQGLKDGLAILEEESPSGAFSFLQLRQ